MKKVCLECQEPINGRADKKYCDDVCRNAYNNRKRSEVNNHMRNINRRLAANRKILETLNPHGKSKTTRQEMILRGFDFNFFTSIYETKKGGRYYFVYEQGYIELPDHTLALVVQKDYVNQKVR